MEGVTSETNHYGASATRSDIFKLCRRCSLGRFHIVSLPSIKFSYYQNDALRSLTELTTRTSRFASPKTVVPIWLALALELLCAETNGSSWVKIILILEDGVVLYAISTYVLLVQPIITYSINQ
jgi:hypothetical protein